MLDGILYLEIHFLEILIDIYPDLNQSIISIDHYYAILLKTQRIYNVP